MTSGTPIEQADFDALLELLDRDTMREVIGMFAASAPERLAVAHAGLASGDLVSVATACHTMRSGCGQLGARRMEELCASGERAAKAGDAGQAAVYMQDVGTELERCLSWFRAQGWIGA
jgi:HPt (histidine-containing phosphotransfer) domain-containing protein